MTAVAATGSADTSIHGRRRPRRERVRSERWPASGSETASQTREARNSPPITSGGTSKTSVAYFIRYTDVRKNRKPNPRPGSP